MLLQKFKITFKDQLVPIYGNNETMEFFHLLCDSLLGFSRVDISLNFDYVLNQKQLEKFEDSLERLLKQEPIQYIIGTAYFYGNTFLVTPNTLIPRPETEELVDWIASDNPTKKCTIVDIGTGTGCIAISLAKKLASAKVSAIDFSFKAIEVAHKNAEQNNVSVNFIEKDILIQDKLSDDFNIIVSNPPYVRELEKKEMSANVLDFEPDSALFVSDSDPLIFYRKIAQLIVNTYYSSEKQRLLYYEINEYLAKETAEMLKQLGFHSIELKNDFRGKPRMLKAFWK